MTKDWSRSYGFTCPGLDRSHRLLLRRRHSVGVRDWCAGPVEGRGITFKAGATSEPKSRTASNSSAIEALRACSHTYGTDTPVDTATRIPDNPGHRIQKQSPSGLASTEGPSGGLEEEPVHTRLPNRRSLDDQGLMRFSGQVGNRLAFDLDWPSCIPNEVESTEVVPHVCPYFRTRYGSWEGW